MSTFPRFLIDQGIVSENDVLDALVTSLTSQPSLSSIVHDHKLIPVSDQICALEYQAKHNTTYRQSLVALGLWSDGLEKSLQQHISKLSIPFSAVLVQKKRLDFPAILRAFDEFVATPRTEGSTDNSLTLNAASPSDSAKSQTNRQSIDYFGKCFDLSRYGLMTSMINDWNNFPADSRSQLISTLIGEWGSLQVISSEIGASELASLFEAGIYMLENNRPQSDTLSLGSLAHLTTIALNVTHIAWALRERIVKSRTTSLKDDDAALRFRYETILSAVKTIKAAA